MSELDEVEGSTDRHSPVFAIVSSAKLPLQNSRVGIEPPNGISIIEYHIVVSRCGYARDENDIRCGQSFSLTDTSDLESIIIDQSTSTRR